MINHVTLGEFHTESPLDYTDDDIKDLPVLNFADAYRTMLIRIQKSYPTSKVICILPYMLTKKSEPKEIDAYHQMIQKICDYFGVETIDAGKMGLTMYEPEDNYLLDNVHLNIKGMEMLFNQINNM